jgi:serine/threonine-protein kinase
VENADSAEKELVPGTRVLNRYTIVGKLAQGGMAEVYLARQQGPAGYQKLVVVKRVRPHLARDPDFVAMFVNEARLAAMINHPNVVQIFDLGEEHGDWYLAMEYLDGRDMLQVGRACRGHNKAVPFDVTARIMADTCSGLEFAHNLKGTDGKSLDLVHRDMSPENIIITFEGQVKVVDFGIAKARDNALRTQAGQIKGKLGYVAPEAILGKTLDGRADIFAIGATLYLFLSGRPAFSGNNAMEVFEKSLKPPQAPIVLNPRIPPAIDAICMKALAQDRNDRYRTAGDVRTALDGYLASTGRPLGPPQLSQFMHLLFPADTDPVRARINQMLADAPLFPPGEVRPVQVPADPFDEATSVLEPPPPYALSGSQSSRSGGLSRGGAAVRTVPTLDGLMPQRRASEVLDRTGDVNTGDLNMADIGTGDILLDDMPDDVTGESAPGDFMGDPLDRAPYAVDDPPTRPIRMPGARSQSGSGNKSPSSDLDEPTLGGDLDSLNTAEAVLASMGDGSALERAAEAAFSVGAVPQPPTLPPLPPAPPPQAPVQVPPRVASVPTAEVPKAFFGKPPSDLLSADHPSTYDMIDVSDSAPSGAAVTLSSNPTPAWPPAQAPTPAWPPPQAPAPAWQQPAPQPPAPAWQQPAPLYAPPSLGTPPPPAMLGQLSRAQPTVTPVAFSATPTTAFVPSRDLPPIALARSPVPAAVVAAPSRVKGTRRDEGSGLTWPVVLGMLALGSITGLGLLIVALHLMGRLPALLSP